MADFADLKSSWTRGHSRSVAELAKAAGIEARLSTEQCDQLSRAGLVHDLGQVGIENGIWDKPGDLSTDEWEKVRLHSYWTDRILSRCPALAPLGALASSHHERMDGTGYHRQSTADQLTVEARLLAAADVLVALTSRRPHRNSFDLETAATLMREAASIRHLDKAAVEFAIAAVGGKAENPESFNPDGLTDREIEVLKLLSRGSTNRQVARQLFISVKTVGRHVENIYAKIGVSTRAGTAIYAMENRLIH
jgi:HD-GYP domain-containing protein (c-di-GMP phosphodiesterase class II)